MPSSRAVLLVLLSGIINNSGAVVDGHVRTYKYNTQIAFNDSTTEGVWKSWHSKSVGFKLETYATLRTVWENSTNSLLALQISKAKLHSTSKTSEVDASFLMEHSVFFEQSLNSGLVGRVFSSMHDSAFAVNIKKGIISLFQMQLHDSEREEVDVSGQCEVRYARVSKDLLTKVQGKCIVGDTAVDYRHPVELLNGALLGQSETRYHLQQGDALQSADHVDMRTFTLNTQRSISLVAQAHQELILMTTVSGPPVSTVGTAREIVSDQGDHDYVEGTLAYVTQSAHCKQDCLSLTEAVEKQKDFLVKEKLSSVASTEAFITLLPIFRSAMKQDIIQILQDNPVIENQLIDIATAAQTDESIEALMSHLTFDAQNPDRSERYLMAVSFSSHPSALLVQSLLELYRKDVDPTTLKESLSLALGAVVKSFCHKKNQCDSELVQDVMEALSYRLSSCATKGTKEETCRLLVLRTMRNAQLSATLPILIQEVLSSKMSSVAYAAVEAIEVVTGSECSLELFLEVNKIFHQSERLYDSPVRMKALDVILRHYPLLTVQHLRNIFLSAINSTDFETSTLILRKLQAADQPALRLLMDEALAGMEFQNYHTLAPGGLSSALASYFGRTSVSNVTYLLSTHMAISGALKRSSMDVTFGSGALSQSILKFSLYAQGIESLIGEADAASPTEDPTAGMQLDAMGVTLRPVEFFRGSAGLMSAVWSAPSERVSALALNILLHDMMESVPLHNGMMLEAKLEGGASIDLSGYVSISLWNRDAHSVVTNAGAAVIRGSLSLVPNDHIAAGAGFSLKAASAIDFSTDVNFYEMPVRLCLRMTQNPYLISKITYKHENCKKLLRNYMKRVTTITSVSGSSYLLDKRNSLECTSLLEV